MKIYITAFFILMAWALCVFYGIQYAQQLVDKLVF